MTPLLPQPLILLLFDGRWPLFPFSTGTITAGVRGSWLSVYPYPWGVLEPLASQRHHMSGVLLFPTPASAVLVTVSSQLSLVSGTLFLHLFFLTVTIFLASRSRSAVTSGDWMLGPNLFILFFSYIFTCLVLFPFIFFYLMPFTFLIFKSLGSLWVLGPVLETST